jgi:hypothetical protein
MDFSNWLQKTEDDILKEYVSRYSIGVNYRTDLDEVLDGFGKLSLGFLSAAIKNAGYHVKQVYNQTPMRILISTRNWDDGEWVGVVCYNRELNCFIMAKGFYNKDRKTVSIQQHQKCNEKSAADLAKSLLNYMEGLRKEKPRNPFQLKPAKLKRGPKPGYLVVGRKKGPKN